MDAKTKALIQKEAAERCRLLAISEGESWGSAPAEWYQRGRYIREIYAEMWVAALQRGIPREEAARNAEDSVRMYN